MERLKFKDINEWSLTEIISRLKTTTLGTSNIEAQKRQIEFGLNIVHKSKTSFLEF